MPLFTSQERLAIWQQLKSGRTPRPSAALAHLMAGRSAILQQWREHLPDRVHCLETVYRLVDRGLITTADQFRRISKELLDNEGTDSV